MVEGNGNALTEVNRVKSFTGLTQLHIQKDDFVNLYKYMYSSLDVTQGSTKGGESLLPGDRWAPPHLKKSEWGAESPCHVIGKIEK